MPDTAIRIDPFFLNSPQGPLFCLYIAPSGSLPGKGILHLHAFAEEMHKSRRMTALQARTFAHAGYGVLMMDFTGCGDSAGDFEDANWEVWRDNARLAHAWLAERVSGPVTLWGLRTGANLAVDVSASLPGLARLLLWQPVASGEQFLTQFLRIKLASEMLSKGQAQSSTRELRARLDAGEPIEIGGYTLSPQMAHSLAGLTLAGTYPPCAVEWLEVGASNGDDIPPASRQVLDAWHNAGVRARGCTVAGEPFWITPEISECPALIEATLNAITR